MDFWERIVWLPHPTPSCSEESYIKNRQKRLRKSSQRNKRRTREAITMEVNVKLSGQQFKYINDSFKHINKV